MLRADRIDPDRAFVLVIDVQEKLLPLIRHHERVLAATCKLLDGAEIFALPIVATEQYPKGIGATVPDVQTRLSRRDVKVLEKMSFSGCGEPHVQSAVREVGRPQAIIVGIEAHVCVQQTALDLASGGYDVFVCADAIGSRGKMDFKLALARMRQAGVFVTTVESALFELCERCDTKEFKAMIEIIKRTPPPQD